MILVLPEIVPIPEDHLDAVVDVFADAFRGYPVMRFTVGAGAHGSAGEAGDPGYDARERRLIRLFVERRVARGGPLFGVSARYAETNRENSTGKNIDGAILLTQPGEPDMTHEVARISGEAWRDLGDDARRRYEEYAGASNFFRDYPPHLHLNMIGVRASAKGTGLGGRLIEKVRALAEENPAYAGVSLTTENPRNVDLYRHFGYDVVGHAPFGDGLTTWGMYLRLR